MVRTVASPLRLSGPEPPVRPAPDRGADTEEVLVELCGYEPERVRKLAAAGVFGAEKGAANA
jgi:crotonobetainyl-CoA:carnitine CoA-transferase CaiB-like acyl-CoA transferase